MIRLRSWLTKRRIRKSDERLSRIRFTGLTCGFDRNEVDYRYWSFWTKKGLMVQYDRRNKEIVIFRKGGVPSAVYGIYKVKREIAARYGTLGIMQLQCNSLMMGAPLLPDRLRGYDIYTDKSGVVCFNGVPVWFIRLFNDVKHYFGIDDLISCTGEGVWDGSEDAW